MQKPSILIMHNYFVIVFEADLNKSRPFRSVPYRQPDTRDGILGQKFTKRLESFAPCYLQSLLLADFKENHSLLWFYNYLQKIREIRKLASIHE
jgi:hypothetical protein